MILVRCFPYTSHARFGVGHFGFCCIINIRCVSTERQWVYVCLRAFMSVLTLIIEMLFSQFLVVL